ncbi:MAG: UDP-N-acetylmuramyl-tripeptide synthetase [Peptostreptococcaceae bacterium]|nr:UDP-N-acetylmuramyl-tripeptide synthetase [Peptostreptococcaceae bacterium]
MNKKLLYITIGIVVIFIGGCTSTKTTNISVLATTDLHGTLPYELSDYVANEKSKDKNITLVDAGDFFDSGFGASDDMNRYFDKRREDRNIEKYIEAPIAKEMKDIGYDAVVLGNHEFVSNNKFYLDNLISDFEKELNENTELKELKTKYKLLIESSINGGNLDEAIKMINEYESMFSEEFEILNMKAVIALMSSQLDKAEKLLKNSWIYNSEDFNVIFNIAYLKELIGDKQEAKQFYENIINNCNEADIVREASENIKKLDTKCYTYAIDHEADFMAKDIKIEARGVSYKLVTPTYEEDIFVPVPGKFTVYNTLAVIATCYALEIPKEIVLNGLKNTGGVAGRFEAISNETGISVIVDYAHTPDALENVINTAREFVKNRIITVFGCGGDRDTTKRPLMGEIVQKYSDICIVTSDNPRTEDPELIINDILEGLDKSKENYKVVIDRKEAIKEAIEMAQKGDVILIAGKGHENYQIIGKVKHHFDDKEIANEFLQNK